MIPARPLEQTSPATTEARRDVEAAPEVHVTIGRIEVTGAVQPPPPVPEQPPAAPATPRLSLDEYLERRNGETK
jgi:hypothetical protein